jgi:hypothetical protein
MGTLENHKRDVFGILHIWKIFNCIWIVEDDLHKIIITLFVYIIHSFGGFYVHLNSETVSAESSVPDAVPDGFQAGLNRFVRSH